jgi:hypothetical protein
MHQSVMGSYIGSGRLYVPPCIVLLCMVRLRVMQ